MNNKNLKLPAHVRILRALMEEANLKESELARQVNLPQTTINRLLLGGTSDPRANTLKPIADFFGVTIGQLCGFEPLNAQRITGATNPIERSCWHTIPIIQWDNVKSWLFDKKKITPYNHAKWVTTERQLSHDAFALHSLAFMEPRFRKSSILIIDPKAKYKDGHFIIIGLEGPSPTVRKILIDGAEVWLKAFDQNQLAVKLNKKHMIYGVIVESRIDTYHV